MRVIAAVLASAAVSVGLMGLAGCTGTEGRARTAEAAALAFVAELRGPDLGRACEALAPSTREELEEEGGCVRALTALRLGPAAAGAVRTEVYGSQARVVHGDENIYLASFPDGWKITAAGCTPRPGRPDRCVVKGG
ncbi:hypothetical protein ACFV9D_11575 [Streptomyces sp. NPDC059875]|uniref:hypothetical protein n=1 Tax=unclassified Streptomyces TaxID=2593676 RepID=UPI0036681CA0